MLPQRSQPSEEVQEPAQVKKTKKKSPKVKRLTPNAVVQRMKFGEAGVSICVDDFGENNPECFTEGTVIWISIRQHPLYQTGVEETRDSYLKRYEAYHSGNFLDEGYKKSAPGLYEAKQTPSRRLYWRIRRPDFFDKKKRKPNPHRRLFTLRKFLIVHTFSI